MGRPREKLKLLSTPPGDVVALVPLWLSGRRNDSEAHAPFAFCTGVREDECPSSQAVIFARVFVRLR